MKTTVSPKSKIVVLPTDTLYGICTSAFDKAAVERIYDIKGRDENKPFIVLISKLSELEKFGISPILLRANKQLLASVWPGKVSVILPLQKSALKKFAYLHRGTGKLAFRLPRKKALLAHLKKSGPLVAPSANPQGLKPAETIAEAKKYFSTNVDQYIAGGRLVGSPSTIIEIANDGSVKLVRQGAVRVKYVTPSR
jgi:L-threonylcarbamoyladenylate synthase